MSPSSEQESQIVSPLHNVGVEPRSSPPLLELSRLNPALSTAEHQANHGGVDSTEDEDEVALVAVDSQDENVYPLVEDTQFVDIEPDTQAVDILEPAAETQVVAAVDLGQKTYLEQSHHLLKRTEIHLDDDIASSFRFAPAPINFRPHNGRPWPQTTNVHKSASGGSTPKGDQGTLDIQKFCKQFD